MRSGLKGNHMDASLSREELVGGPPYFGELEKCPHRFWYKSLTLILFVYMLL